MKRYTADELIQTVRARAGVPNTTALGVDDATILAFLNEEMFTRLVPALIQINENYLLAVERQVIETGTTHYRIPSRAIGQRLHDLALVDSAGDDPGVSTDFYTEGNYVVLAHPEDVAGNYLEMSFFMRPGELLLSSACRVITSIDTSTGIITVDSTTPWVTGQLFDIHSPDSGAEVKAWDVASVDISGPTVTVGAEDVNGSRFGFKAAVGGDYLVPADHAAIPALPRELHPILAQAAVARVWQALGDVRGEQAALAAVDRMMQAALPLVTPRVQRIPETLSNPDSVYFGGH